MLWQGCYQDQGHLYREVMWTGQPLLRGLGPPSFYNPPYSLVLRALGLVAALCHYEPMIPQYLVNNSLHYVTFSLLK